MVLRRGARGGFDLCLHPEALYESKTNSGTRHQFWAQGACDRNFLTPRLIWMLKYAHIIVLGLSSMLIYFLSIQQLITHAEMPFNQAIKCNMEKIIT